ncbi:dihydrofolate reductase-like domain-containing protein [Xylaria sp. CBS 124048]|nr:dihydrofolate reductase-like domain-containing protein [Xylaria sp. CBS 124048]
MASQQPASLTEAEKEFFLEHGYLRLRNCFTREQSDEVCENVWTRLGMDPNDKSTWIRERTNMPSHRTFDASKFAPKAWAAICELCGGEERIEPKSKEWRDSLIVNLGTPEKEGKPVLPRKLPGWHVDGDFFIHYLDSPEQGLLVIPLFTDIKPQGGGTVICPPGIEKMARWLHANPDGVSPWMRPRDHEGFKREKNPEWYSGLMSDIPDEAFVEVTGEVGDVYLLHPLMMHSASENSLRQVRIITNPPVSLREPHCFDREDGNYSLVERKTMRGIGEEKLKDWKITGPREAVIPERVRIQEAMKLEELKRLQAEGKQAAAVAVAMSKDMLPLELALIVAATRNMGIGRNGTLPWTGLKKEMAYFTRVTKRPSSSQDSDDSMNAVIMGRKTWDSIPPKFRPLKGRLNIVISRSHVDPPARDVNPDTDAVKAGSLEQAIEYLRSGMTAAQTGKIFVIGGAQIYAAALRLKEVKRVLLTSIMTDFECDTFFPIQLSESPSDTECGRWVRKSKKELDQWTGETVPEGVQEENQTQYEFQMWERVE